MLDVAPLPSLSHIFIAGVWLFPFPPLSPSLLSFSSSYIRFRCLSLALSFCVACAHTYTPKPYPLIDPNGNLSNAFSVYPEVSTVRWRTEPRLTSIRLSRGGRSIPSIKLVEQADRRGIGEFRQFAYISFVSVLRLFSPPVMRILRKSIGDRLSRNSAHEWVTARYPVDKRCARTEPVCLAIKESSRRWIYGT